MGLLNAESLVFERNPDAQGWINYIGEIELSLFSDSIDSRKKNGIYIRELIDIFILGAEDTVEEMPGIYGKLNKNAIVTEGFRVVICGNVKYAYIVDRSFFVMPYTVDEPEEPIPKIIKPQ